MYVAVKGGEQAIANAHQRLAEYRRGPQSMPALTVAQIQQQLPFAVARVMTEGSVYDPQLAALAIKQSAGDLLEAVFLLRAYRTTLSRFCTSLAINTTQMQVSRRVSATYKDLPGGQRLGATFDYSHRLLDFKLLAEGEHAAVTSSYGDRHPSGHPSGDSHSPSSDEEFLQGQTPLPSDLPSACSNEDRHPTERSTEDSHSMQDIPRAMQILEREGLMAKEVDDGAPPTDITRDPISFPCDRSARLQSLVRGDEGFLLSLGYSTQRGYGRNHPFTGEIRVGEVEVLIVPEALGFAVSIGDIEVTECETVNGFTTVDQERPVSEPEAQNEALFTRGYGLAFGYAERKAMSMALVDRALQADRYQEERDAPAQQEEFVLAHCDNVEAAGFVSHLKLPHYVDFQSELELLRKLRRARSMHSSADETTSSTPEDSATPNHPFEETSA